MTDGTISGNTYQINATCTEAYEMIYYNNYLYAISTCTNDQFIVYDIVSDSFTFYEFTSTISIRSIAYEPIYGRLIFVGDQSSTNNYIVKASVSMISDIPELSSSTVAMTSLESGYTYNPYNLTVVGPTTYDQTNITLSTTNITSSTNATYSTDLISDTTTYTNSSLIEQTYYQIDVDLTCSIGGSTSITYELVSYNGSSVPDWITLDSTNFRLTGTTSNIDVNTQYTFAINATANGTTYQKVISLTVSTKCAVGYIEYPHSNRCHNREVSKTIYYLIALLITLILITIF